jgi:D-proline reductase (dithiol) PrdB
MDILQHTGEEAENRRARFESWLEDVPKWHEHFVFTFNKNVNFTKPVKPLSQARVGLLSTGGIHLKTQPPFDVASEYGDWSFREIPADSDPDALRIADTHYDHSDADEDINCLFPISHLNTLAAEGFIGETIRIHYGFMGFIPNPAQLITDTAPQAARGFIEQGVDLVLLTPG